MISIPSSIGVYFLAVLVAGLLVSAFIAEQVNLLKKPRSVAKRKRWRYGRRMGIAVVVSGAALAVFQNFVVMSNARAAVFALILLVALWTLITIYHKEHSRH